MKIKLFIILVIALANTSGDERTAEVIGKYLNSRYKIIFDRSAWTEQDSKNINEALSEIDSLPKEERLKVYTLFYLYFDNDTDPASTLTEIIIKNKDVLDWKKYLKKNEYDVKRVYGDENYQYLNCKLAMIVKFKKYNRDLFNKAKECQEIKKKKN